MQEYPKKYENVFSSDDRIGSNSKLIYDAISIEDFELDKYIPLFRNFLLDAYNLKIFDICVRFAWLRRKFRYHSEKTHPTMKKNSVRLSNAFLKFTRRSIGINSQLISRSVFFHVIESYLEDFFPGFDEGNPFENPDYYKFPFKNISIDYLIVVRQLDDRVDLLKIAEERKMSYAVFTDYVINHVECINETLSKKRYELVDSKTDGRELFFIRDKNKMRKKNVKS